MFRSSVRCRMLVLLFILNLFYLFPTAIIFFLTLSPPPFPCHILLCLSPPPSLLAQSLWLRVCWCVLPTCVSLSRLPSSGPSHDTPPPSAMPPSFLFLFPPLVLSSRLHASLLSCLQNSGNGKEPDVQYAELDTSALATSPSPRTSIPAGGDLVEYATIQANLC